MITFSEICTVSNSAESAGLVNITALPFDRRQRSRLRVTINQGPLHGQAAAIHLPRGTVLRNGQRLSSGDGQTLRIEAASEPLLIVRAPTQQALTVIAYHLGNRHVPIQIEGDNLRLERDSVLHQMILGLGGSVQETNGPFDPESGAYRSHTDKTPHTPHHHGDERHAPRIHDLANTQ